MRHSLIRIAAALFVLMAGTAAEAQQSILRAPDEPQFVDGEIIIKYKPRVTVNAVQTALQAFGASFSEQLPLIDADLIKFPSAQFSVQQVVEGLADRLVDNNGESLVEYIQPNFILHATRTPNDPFYRSQWGLSKIRAPGAWDNITDASSVIIGVVDTGIDYTHPDIAANMWTNPSERPNGRDDDGNGIADDIYGASYTSAGTSGNPHDDQYHGTHVAGIIAAVTNNGRGVAGTAWRAKLMAIKFLNSQGSGRTSDAVKGIAYALNKGAHILNNSWGCNGRGCYNPALLDCIQQAERRGVLFVAAAGNNNSDNDRDPHYPSNYNVDNVISVMSSERGDRKSPFSNFGRNTVQMAAPGSSILSSLPGNRYGSLSGTSMAAPFVAGAAALLKALNPNWDYKNIKAQILATVDKPASLAGLSQTGGRLALAKSVSAPVRFRKPIVSDNWAIGSRNSISWDVSHAVPGCQSLHADLSTDDGNSFPHRLASNISNDGGHSVTLPLLPTRTAKVRLKCTGANFQAVSGRFTIYTPLEITQPVAASEWPKRGVREITWKGAVTDIAPMGCETLDVDLSTNDGNSYAHPVASGIANSGRQSITLPDVATRGARIRLRCTHAEYRAKSQRFRIYTPLHVTEPSGRTEWRIGGTGQINWQGSVSDIAPVGCEQIDLKLSTDGGSTFGVQLASNIPNAGNHSVAVPHTPTRQGRVRIECTAAEHADNSDDDFLIFVPIRVTEPNAKTRWWANGPWPVRWEGGIDDGGHPACQKVDIHLSLDDGATFPRLLAADAANSGMADLSGWEVSSDASKIRVACQGPTLADDSEAFRIVSLFKWFLAGAGLFTGLVFAF